MPGGLCPSPLDQGLIIPFTRGVVWDRLHDTLRLLACIPWSDFDARLEPNGSVCGGVVLAFPFGSVRFVGTCRIAHDEATLTVSLAARGQAEGGTRAQWRVEIVVQDDAEKAFLVVRMAGSLFGPLRERLLAEDPQHRVLSTVLTETMDVLIRRLSAWLAAERPGLA